MGTHDIQLLHILIKVQLSQVSRIFSWPKQWLYTHGWSWRGDICTLVTGRKKPKQVWSDPQLHLTCLSALLISPKGIPAWFYCDSVAVQRNNSLTVILLLLTEACRFRLECFAWQENPENHLAEVHQSVSIIEEEVIHHVWNVWHAFSGIMTITVESGGQNSFFHQPFLFFICFSSQKEHLKVRNLSRKIEVTYVVHVFEKILLQINILFPTG